MNNRIKSIIITVTAIVLAFSLLIACDGNVITNTDNGRAYTEVIATNGAFVYKGQNYDFMEDVIKAIKASGEAGTVKLAGNVYSRPVSIPEGADVTIDLDGHEMKFFDVKNSALKVLENSILSVKNGTLSLNSTDNRHAVIETNGAENLNLSNLKINASGQKALNLNGVKHAYLAGGVEISGAVVASGGNGNTHLLIKNNLSDVRMNGASLVVEGSGIANVTENNGTNSYEVSPDGAIIDRTQSINPQDVEEGYWYIERNGIPHVYGSLQEAVESLEAGDTELVLIDNETTEPAVEITLNQNIILNLQGYTTKTNNITLTNGTDLTIKNSSTTTSYFTGTVTSAEGGTSSLSVVGDVVMNSEINVTGSLTGEGATFKDDITASGNINLTGSKFDSGTETHPAVTSTNGDISMANVSGTVGAIIANGEDGKGNISIDNTGADVALNTGALTTGSGDITVKGYSSAKPVTVNGDVSVNGSLTSSNAVFKGNVSADGDISLTGSTFNSGTATAPNVSSTNGDISMTKVSGTAGAITANGTDGDVTIDNSNVTTTTVPFTTGAISATDTVDIKGNADNLTVEIGGSIYADKVSIENSHLSISAGGIAKGKTETAYTPASSVTIENPINTSEQSFSYIGNLYAKELSVSAASAGGTLGVGNAVVSGSGSSSIGGGFFENFIHAADGVLTVTGGNFSSFDYGSGTKENNILKGGSFDVVVPDSDTLKIDKVNALLGFVPSDGNITIYYVPTGLINLTGTLNFDGLTAGNATISFYNYSLEETLSDGFVIDSGSSASLVCASNINIGGSPYVKLNGTLTSNVKLITDASPKDYYVHKLKTDNTYSESIKETELSVGYQYTANVDVVFHSNNDPDGTVLKVFEYNTAVTLPTADSMDIKKEYYEVDYWTASAQSTEPVYNDGANVTLTADTELYAHWKETGVAVTFSAGFSPSIVSLSKTTETYKIGIAFGSDEQGTAKGLPTVTFESYLHNRVLFGWLVDNKDMVTDDTVVDSSFRGKTLTAMVVRTDNDVKSIALADGPFYDLNANPIGGAFSGGIYYVAINGDYAVGETKDSVSIQESDGDYTFLAKDQMNKIQAAIVALSKITGTTAYKASDANEYFIVSGDSGYWTGSAPSSYKNLYPYSAYGGGGDNVDEVCRKLINQIK